MRTETETEIRDRQSVRQTRREAETGPRLYMAEQYEKNELTRKTLVASVEKKLMMWRCNDGTVDALKLRRLDMGLDEMPDDNVWLVYDCVL